jgi:hypothetical protein
MCRKISKKLCPGTLTGGRLKTATLRKEVLVERKKRRKKKRKK